MEKKKLEMVKITREQILEIFLIAIKNGLFNGMGIIEMDKIYFIIQIPGTFPYIWNKPNCTVETLANVAK